MPKAAQQVDLIVDANVATQVFGQPKEALSPVQAALMAGQARAVHGGRLTDEYLRIGEALRFLRLLDQKGAARLLPEAKVRAAEAALAASGRLESDDPHVLAIAQLGSVRLLVSDDAALIRDFQNPALLSAPKGRVYSTLSARAGRRSRPDVFAALLRSSSIRR